jgi:steroid 5-alpha reductase family enzyme
MLLTAFCIGLSVTLVMFAAWVLQARVQNAGWVDVFWTFGTGLICALAALATGPVPWRRALVAGLLLLWSVRLGAHILHRVMTGAEDVRYARMRAAYGAGFQKHLLGFVTVQGPFSLVLGIAALYAARQPNPAFRLWDALAIALALACLAGEALADRQMRHFRANPANKGKICDTGLWRYSRHPNYLFEFLSWGAYPLLGLTAHNPWSLLSLAAPALMYLTLRYASGVPPLEAAMLESRGEAYRRYQAHTGAILPRLCSSTAKCAGGGTPEA